MPASFVIRVSRRSRRSRRAWIIALSALAAGLATTSARAQSPAPAPAGLSLDSAIKATIAGNAKIRFDALRAESFRGQLVSAAAPFDGQLQTSVMNGHDNQQLPLVVNGLPIEAWTAQDAVTYQVQLDKQLRSGIILSPSLQVSRTDTRAVQSQQFPTSGIATAGLKMTMPLMANRGGSISAVAEHVTELDWRGTVQDSRQTVASTVNDVIAAYWNYLAAERRLDAYVTAEGRAQRMLDETVILVQKEERAPADLKQLSANLSSKRAARIGAEQSLVEAREQLGLYMGLRSEAILALPMPSTDFPPVREDSASDTAIADRLRPVALAHRSDLAAAREKNAATVMELEEFQNAAKPHVDLIVGLGFTGSEDGMAFNRFFSPLYRNVPGLNASVQLSYQLPTTNAAGRGRVMQEDAFLGQQRLAKEDAERQILTGVVVSVEALHRSRLILRESESATGLYAATVDNERRKFQLGMSTLFDVLNAEDGLTNAQLSEINGRRAHATAIAALRFASGTLVEWDADRPFVPAARLATAP